MLNENYYDSNLTQLGKAKDWDDLDSFFDMIRIEILPPLEMKLKCNIAFDPFFEIKKCAFQDLFLDLSKTQPKTVNVSQMEKLNQRIQESVQIV